MAILNPPKGYPVSSCYPANGGWREESFLKLSAKGPKALRIKAFFASRPRGLAKEEIGGIPQKERVEFLRQVQILALGQEVRWTAQSLPYTRFF